MSDVYVNDINYYALESDARVVVLYGGRDSGKSWFVGGQKIPLSMMQEDYVRGIAIKKTYNSCKDTVFLEIEDGVDELGVSNEFNFVKNPLEVTHNNGNKFIFRGLDDPKKLKSIKGINRIWVEEAEDLTETQYDDLLILLRGKGKQQMILTYNPMDEEHFTNERFVLAKKDRIIETFEDGEPKVWEIDVSEEIDGELAQYTILVICSTYNDNDFISPVRKLVIEKLKYTNPFLYEIYSKGRYATRGGRIFTNTQQISFAEKEWEFNNFDNKGYVQDFGFNHANCILSVAEKDNNLFIFSEIYEYEKDTSELIDTANSKMLDKKLQMICDCAEPDRIKTWVKAGYRAKGVKKYPGSVKAQIDKAKTYDNIYINTTCINTWKESKSYMWKKNKHGKYTDDPTDIFDDAMACIRYSKDLFDSTGWQFA